MKRPIAVALMLSFLALSACVGTPKDTPMSKSGARDSGDEMVTVPPAGVPGAGAGVGDWLWKTPTNALYWPWKIVGRAGRGLFDGVAAGFDQGGPPILGALFSPVNAVVGFVTGLFDGAAMPPLWLTGETDVGAAFARPTDREIAIWWFE